ncbi:tripartite tricarboxylate transporter substrate binding protein [Bradyrhizobium prioriisuperbiae]|uniref:Bug family tripartite tricarboxylate transporter substrate binding protein n=1 Tax=Bradyrhizobium prioriisuperbiae TaxID=2854389 RepID=UPI0028EB7422|nr:tripartite tricarboxylate transporter substrate binding protein [Bradyrhizobium prioritasuperba]
MLDRRHFLAAALAAPSIATSPARAADWPGQPVRLIVPFAPGGATDVIGRLLATRLSEIWGQQVVVDNLPGADANIGSEVAAKAAPDGYTMAVMSVPLAVNRFLYASLSYDPVADFAPVSLLVMQPNIIAVSNVLPVRSVGDFIAHAKANAGKLRYASSGNGTSLHLCGELFKRLAGVEIIHVPYQGAGPAIGDLIPGRVDVMFDNVSSIQPHVKSGSVRGLAVTTARRILATPDLPTIAEAGVPGFDVSSWFALYVPAKTPPEIIARINRDSAAALQHASVKPRLEELGSEIVGSTPEALAAHLAAEMDKWGPVIRDAKIRID